MEKIYLIFLLIWAFPAYAYIDTSTGSMLFQGIVAVLMLLPFYFRKILMFFSKKRKNDVEE